MTKKIRLIIILVIFLFTSISCDKKSESVKSNLTINKKHTLSKDILKSIFDDIVQIEEDYVPLYGFKEDANFVVSGLNRREDFSSEEAFNKNWSASLSFNKNMGPASKKYPIGELLGEDSCILDVRFQNIRNGQMAYGLNSPCLLQLIKYPKLDMEVVISIGTLSDPLRDRLRKLIFNRLKSIDGSKEQGE